MVHKDKTELLGTNVLKYIEWGEEQGFHKRPTCASRQRWYDLGKWTFASHFWTEFFFEVHKTFCSPGHIFESDKHYGILPRMELHKAFLALYLNCSLMPLFRLISGFQALGEGVLKMPVYEVAKLPVINPDLLTNDILSEIEHVFEKIRDYKVTTLFEEIGFSTDEIDLKSINRYRKMIDDIILIKILGLSETDLLDLYKAIIDLLRARIDRAKTVVRRKKKKGVNVEALANGIINRLTTRIKKFPDAYLSDYKGLWSDEIRIPEGKPTMGSDIGGFYVQVRGEEVHRSWDQDEVKFVYFSALTGASHVKLPLDKQAMKAAVEAFEREYNTLKEEVRNLLLTLIPDSKIRKKVEDYVWNILFLK